MEYIGIPSHCQWGAAFDYQPGGDLLLQLTVASENETVVLICSSLAGEEKLRFNAAGSDSAWEVQKRIAGEMHINLPNLQLILPDGQLLAKVCRANPQTTLIDVAEPLESYIAPKAIFAGDQ